MKQRLFWVLLLILFVPGFLLVSGSTAHADDHGNGNGHSDDHDKDHGNKHDKDDHHGNDEHATYRYYDPGPYSHYHGGRYDFRGSDYVVLQQHYGGPRNLPPGLRKKYYRTGTLPPGWEKRFQPMPVVVVQQLPPIPVYYQRGYIDGYAVVYDRRTRIIIDSVDLIGAVSGH